MANDTFRQIWNRLRLHVPNLPVLLAKDFVKLAYREIVDSHYWSELRVDAEFLVPDYYATGTVDVTNGSTTITGTGTTFTSAMVGRQIMIGSIAPMYTIASFVGADEITIDRDYEGATDTDLSYEIGQYYVEFPTDLSVLEKVRDQANGWYLATQWYTQEYLDRVDAKRNSAGTPTMLVPAPSRTDSSNNVIPRYELWPRSQSQKLYQYRYTKDVSLVNDSDIIMDAITPNTVLYGALKHVAMWPGLPDSPNPAFGQDKQQQYAETYEQLRFSDELSDVDRAQTMISLADDVRRRFPFDAKYLQEHIW